MSTPATEREGVLLRRQEGGVVTLTMNRPERRNALDVEMTLRMREALQSAAADSAVRAVVLTGAGGAFCAGGDVKNMAGNPMAADSATERTRTLRFRAEASRLLHDMPKPTIAVIGGAAAGAGLSLALACDFRLARAGAKLTTAFGKVGLSGDFGMSWLLPRIVGMARARELLMFSSVLTAEEALAAGLVHRVYDAETFDAQCAAFVQELAAGPTGAYGRMKANLKDALEPDFGASLDRESASQVAGFSTADHREAAHAFVEKRAPRFTGV